MGTSSFHHSKFFNGLLYRWKLVWQVKTYIAIAYSTLSFFPVHSHYNLPLSVPSIPSHLQSYYLLSPFLPFLYAPLSFLPNGIWTLTHGMTPTPWDNTDMHGGYSSCQLHQDDGTGPTNCSWSACMHASTQTLLRLNVVHLCKIICFIDVVLAKKDFSSQDSCL